MSFFDQHLQERLKKIREEKLFRELRLLSTPQQPHIIINGRNVLSFSSNDYLGLAAHPHVKEAAARAAREFGAGSGASRLISGSLQPHQELEEKLAAFKGTEAALLFSSGYLAGLGAVTALLGSGDVVVLDKQIHASLVDAARLSGAKIRVFKHNDPADLERILGWCSTQGFPNPDGKILIVTESLFSMDGDVAPLSALVKLKKKYGAWLMVDEAHATGLFGPGRRGVLEELGLSHQVEIQMGTLGKALGTSGGFIAGSRTLIEFLINKARPFIFSTAMPPTVSAATMASLEIIQSQEGADLVQKLQRSIQEFTALTRRNPPTVHGPIFPWLVGDETEAMQQAQALLAKGIYVPAIRYPSVARGQARLRITFSAVHNSSDIGSLASALSSL